MTQVSVGIKNDRRLLYAYMMMIDSHRSLIIQNTYVVVSVS